MSGESNQYADGGMPRGVDSRPGRARPVSTTGSEATVATPSMAWERMAVKWKLIDTVLGGTAAMRKAGRERLPPHPYETDEAYRERLSRATLKNYTSRTLENLTSKAFRDPPLLGSTFPQPLVDLAADIDGEYTGFVVFARAWFNKALARGFAHALIDFSRTETTGGTPRTRADDLREGVRPFWSIVDPLDVLFMRTEKVGGVTQVVEMRVYECDIVQDGRWGEAVRERIRVLYPDHFDVYERREVEGKNTWVIVDSGVMGLGYVPIVTFYIDRKSLCECKPPLEDLAHINVEHFQSASDQRNILTVSRFPILAASGANNADASAPPLVIGPNRWLTLADPQGRIYYVEHAGHAIEAGRKDLEDLEDQMASYGSEFLRKRPGAASATGRTLDSAEAIAPLTAWGIDFKECMERAWGMTADWLNISRDGIDVEFKIKPDVTVGEAKELDALDKARERRDISRVAYLKELQRRDILAPEYDSSTDQVLIDAEPLPDQGAFEATIRSKSSGVSSKTGPDRASLETKPPLTSSGA
jgi:hypothetical protein